ncbi:MAG: type II secretion system protein [Terriglobales bacterium]|jgi:general secretion pathway protein G
MRAKGKARGFTLIEMMIVIVIMAVLLSLALPMYTTSITRTKEARLHHNLVTLNNLIQQYSLDKKQAPQALDDLVSAGYLKSIPDDITGSNTTWQTDQEEPEKAMNPDQTGIASVHSGSDQTSLDGTAYSSWVK